MTRRKGRAAGNALKINGRAEGLRKRHKLGLRAGLSDRIARDIPKYTAVAKAAGIKFD